MSSLGKRHGSNQTGYCSFHFKTSINEGGFAAVQSAASHLSLLRSYEHPVPPTSAKRTHPQTVTREYRPSSGTQPRSSHAPRVYPHSRALPLLLSPGHFIPRQALLRPGVGLFESPEALSKGLKRGDRS